MNTAATKVWELGQPEPEGLFDPKACPTAPKNWFREDPAYAAQLYAMEIRMCGRRPAGVITVCVLDNADTLHEFKVRVAPGEDGIVLDATSRPYAAGPAGR